MEPLMMYGVYMCMSLMYYMKALNTHNKSSKYIIKFFFFYILFPFLGAVSFLSKIRTSFLAFQQIYTSLLLLLSKASNLKEYLLLKRYTYMSTIESHWQQSPSEIASLHRKIFFKQAQFTYLDKYIFMICSNTMFSKFECLLIAFVVTLRRTLNE